MNALVSNCFKPFTAQICLFLLPKAKTNGIKPKTAHKHYSPAVKVACCIYTCTYMIIFGMQEEKEKLN